MKQTKMVKFVFMFLMLIPIVLLVTAITQTFVLKAKKNTLNNAQTSLEQNKKEYETKQDIYDYLTSDEYLSDYYKHNGYEDEDYGNEGDINVEIKNNTEN